MHNIAMLTVALAVVIGLVAYAVRFGRSHFQDLRLDADGIAVLVFGARTIVYPYEDIESVEVSHIFLHPLKDQRFRDLFRVKTFPIYPRWTTVNIHMKSGDPIVICAIPRRPRDFAAELQQRMEQHAALAKPTHGD